jgi:predicted site-specific integrase-resolvase
MLTTSSGSNESIKHVANRYKRVSSKDQRLDVINQIFTASSRNDY